MKIIDEMIILIISITPMKSYSSLIIFVSVFLCLNSCQINHKEKFPFSEQEMSEEMNYGTLLEYAIYDTTKIELVKSMIGDRLKSGEDFLFRKIFVEVNDIIYHYFAGPFIEDYSVESHYLGVVYLEINRRDSCYLFDPKLVYGLNEFDLIVEKVAERYNKTPVEILMDKKMDNVYIPKIYFIVKTKSMDCQDGFVEKIIKVDRFIKDLLREYVKRNFPEKEIRISPFIEVRKNNS